MFTHLNFLWRFIIITFFLLLLISEKCLADPFSKFGIIRANVAQALSDNKWLVCFDLNRGINEDGQILKDEVIGIDIQGNIFCIRGELRKDANDLLALDSYEKPSISFSTNEGYFYFWNPADGPKPFEYPLTIKEYQRFLEKFELYPLLKSSQESSLQFRVLKGNPDSYDRAISIPRPRSVLELENPKAKRIKLGIIFEHVKEGPYIVREILEHSAASESGLKPGDVVVKASIDGNHSALEACFPLPDDRSSRMLSLKVRRKSGKGWPIFLNINVFIPSPVESFLFR